MKFEGLLTGSQQSVICTYSVSDASKLRHSTPFIHWPIWILSSNLRLVFEMDDFLRISSPKPCRNFSSVLSATCPASLTLLDVITPTIVVNTDHESPHYAVFSILQLLSSSYEQRSFSAPSSRKPHSMFFPESTRPYFAPIKQAKL